MRAIFASLLVIVAVAAPGTSSAQFPQKPITLISAYDPGSVGDQVARSLAEAVRKHLSQPIVVVNRPGASGTLGLSEAIGAKADGYTLGLGTIGNLTVQPHRTTLPYGSPDTYVPIAKLISYPNVLMVRADARWKTAGEFLDYARAHPGEVKVGVPGPATVAHLNLEQLNVLAKVRLKAVFFDGGQVRATILGQIDAGIGGPGPIIPYLNTGEGVALGVFDEKRLRLVGDVPTFKELGYDVTLGSIQAIVAPPGTPANVVNVLDEAIRKAVAEPSFIAFAEKTQNTIDYKGPAAFAAELRDSFKKNGDLLRALGLAKE